LPSLGPPSRWRGCALTAAEIGALMPVRLSPSAVSAARERRRAGQRVIGATISYADTQVARTTFTVLLPEPGIAAKGKCVKPTTRNSGKHARRCTRYVVLGKFTHADRAGLNQFQFTGVARRTLAPHRYRLNAMPSAHGETGKTVSTTFTIVR
jgi:hypothetical protein